MQTINVELGTVTIYRGKYEYHKKPCATALGVTEASHRSTIKGLLDRLLEEGKVTQEDVVHVTRGDAPVFKMDHTVAAWMDGRAMGKKPGTHEWLWKGRWKDDEDEDDCDE